ncbi:group 1 glycosyl transferase [Calothrix brevissima NIES-22]|nr:group 1 glycosyl transferase [Calothrix brevissima NIES-22]
MKYLTILDNLEYRGSQRVAQNYSIGMKNLGHEVKVLTINGLGNRADFLENEGIHSYCLKFEQDALPNILQWSPDIVHIHRAGMYDKKVNQIIIDLKKQINPLILETNFFSRVDYKIPPGYIDLHLHLTEWCLWKWLQWSSVLGYKPLASVLPNSVITDAFYRSRNEDIVAKKQQIGIPKDDFVFGRVGSYCESKWHPVIINAFKAVAQKVNNISLVLVAPPPSIQEKIKKLPTKIRQKVFVISPVFDDCELRLLYSMMDVMLHASRIGESFGIVLAESLLCETPIITLSSPAKDNSQVEVVEHNHTGIVVNNQNAFIEAMIKIAGNYEQAALLGKNGRNQILDKFDNSYICSRLNILCKLLSSNRNQPDKELLEKLEGNGFITKIMQKEVVAKINSFNGKLPIYDSLMTKLVHQPWLYKFYTSGILSLKHDYFARVAK